MFQLHQSLKPSAQLQFVQEILKWSHQLTIIWLTFSRTSRSIWKQDISKSKPSHELLDPCFMDLKKIPVLKKTLELRNSFFLSFTQSLQERSLVATTVQPFCGDAAWNLNHSWSSLTMIIYGIIFRACSSCFAISIFKNSGVNPGNTGTPWLSHGVPDIKTTKAHVVKLQIFCQPSSTGWAGLLAIDDLSMQVVGWKKLLTDKGISSSIFAS